MVYGHPFIRVKEKKDVVLKFSAFELQILAELQNLRDLTSQDGLGGCKMPHGRGKDA